MAYNDNYKEWKLGKALRRKLYARDNMTCVYCGCKCIIGNTRTMKKDELSHAATLDHVVSQKDLAATARDDQDFYTRRNDPKVLVVACHACNSEKVHYSVYTYCAMKGLDFAKVMHEIGRRIAINV